MNNDQRSTQSRTKAARAVMITLMVLATALGTVIAGASPASATFSAAGTSYTPNGSGGVNLNFSWQQSQFSGAAADFEIDLVDSETGVRRSFTVQGTGVIAEQYSLNIPSVEPGFYRYVVIADYPGGAVSHSSALFVGPPVENITTTSAQDGTSVDLSWTNASSLEPPVSHIIDVANPVGPMSFTVAGDVTNLTVNDLQPGIDYPVTITTQYLTGAVSSSTVARTATGAAPADTEKPTIKLSVPSVISRYEPRQSPEFSCADNVAIDVCTSSHPNAILTNTPGPETVSVFAMDTAGNRATESTVVTIDWSFIGQFAGVSGNEGIVARFYAATFARLPDQGGYDYWGGRLNTETDGLEAASEFFTTSPEFEMLYGDSVSNEQFVNAIYLNVLGRQPEAAGRAFWIHSLDIRTQTRGSTMAFFANSPEHKTITGTS